MCGRTSAWSLSRDFMSPSSPFYAYSVWLYEVAAPRASLLPGTHGQVGPCFLLVLFPKSHPSAKPTRAAREGSFMDPWLWPLSSSVFPACSFSSFCSLVSVLRCVRSRSVCVPTAAAEILLKPSWRIALDITGPTHIP